MVVLPGVGPTSNIQVDWCEGSSGVGHAMRTGNKIMQLKGAHLIWGGEWCKGEMTNSVMFDRKRQRLCWFEVVAMAAPSLLG